jgi:hypothetical protein
MTRQSFVFVLSACALVACRRESDEVAPAPTAPWAAPRPTSSTEAPGKSPEATTPYRVTPGSTVSVELPAREAKPSGVFRVVRGRLEVDARQLDNTRGTVTIDLGSILMKADDAALERESTQRARNWLNLGSARPDAEIERLRSARFSIQKITKVSAPSGDLGKVKPPDVGAPAGTERRVVTLEAVGQLELNERRTLHTLSLVAELDYAGPATPGALPTQIRVSTTRPFDVVLAEHDIVPRDAQGRLLSADLGLFGRSVGQTARLQAELLLAP